MAKFEDCRLDFIDFIGNDARDEVFKAKLSQRLFRHGTAEVIRDRSCVTDGDNAYARRQSDFPPVFSSS